MMENLRGTTLLRLDVLSWACEIVKYLSLTSTTDMDFDVTMTVKPVKFSSNALSNS